MKCELVSWLRPMSHKKKILILIYFRASKTNNSRLTAGNRSWRRLRPSPVSSSVRLATPSSAASSSYPSSSPTCRITGFQVMSLSVFPSFCLSVSLSLCLSAFLSFCLLTFYFVYLHSSVGLSTFHFVCLSIYISFCLSFYQHFILSVCIHQSVFLNFILSVCLSTFHSFNKFQKIKFYKFKLSIVSVEGPRKVMVGEPLKIKCSASIYNFSQVTLT